MKTIEIINKFKNRGRKEIAFEDTFLSDGSTVFSFYIYSKKIYVLDDRGMDNLFDDYSEEDQTIIYNAIMKNATKE
jgi:hypothetical protein